MQKQVSSKKSEMQGEPDSPKTDINSNIVTAVPSSGNNLFQIKHSC